MPRPFLAKLLKMVSFRLKVPDDAVSGVNRVSARVPKAF